MLSVLWLKDQLLGRRVERGTSLVRKPTLSQPYLSNIFITSCYFMILVGWPMVLKVHLGIQNGNLVVVQNKGPFVQK